LVGVIGMNRILVTGGGGYIGSVVVQKLVKLPNIETVRIIDNSHIRSLAFLDGAGKCEFVNGDIRSDSDLEKSLKDVDTVFHLAALVGDATCDKAPEKAVEVNVESVQRLINFVLKNDVERIILSSTCSLYGLQTGEKCVDENSTPNPTSVYGKTKLDAERLLLQAHRENGLNASMLRLSTVYGSSLPDSMQFNVFVNLFVLNACKMKMIKLFGGDKWRPLLHVRDVADAFVATGEASLSKVSGEVFNVGCNTENYTIRQVAEIIAREVSGTEIVEEPLSPDPRSYRVNFDKIKNTLFFNPCFDLQKGVCELRDLIFDGTYDEALLNR